MEEPITASHQWTREEWLCAHRLALRHSPIGRPYRIIRIFGVVLLFVGAAALVIRLSDLSFLGLLILGAFFASMPLLARLGALKMYAQKADRDMLVTWEISDDRISLKTALVSADLSWSTLVRVTRLPQGFLLYPNDRAFHWLPVHAFASEAEVERFAGMAKAKVGRYDQLA